MSNSPLHMHVMIYLIVFQIRSKREIGLSSILNDDFFDENQLVSEPEDDHADDQENGDGQPALQCDGYDHLRHMTHPSFEEPISELLDVLCI